MKNSYHKAFIGIPKKYTKCNMDIYDTLNNINFKQVLNLTTNIPIIFYLSGSAGFTKGETYRKWIVKNTNCIFFSPNTLEITNRPFYNDNSSIEQYEKVHNIRQKEISFNIKKLLEFSWINKNKIFLMGNSEGALAAGIFKDYNFCARLLLAWNCQAGYYKKTVKIGAKKDTPILSIIGTDDEYFSKNSKKNKNYNITGNCIKKLKNFTDVKNIILSNTKHNLLNNKYVKNEIISFINLNLKNYKLN